MPTKRRNENVSNEIPTKRRIAHTASWSSTPSSTSNYNRSIASSDKKARADNPPKPQSVDDKKDAIFSDKKSRRRISNNSVMQMKLLLLEFKRRKRDNEEIFHISDGSDKRKISDAVFCFEKENRRCLYQAKYYSHESRAYRKINFNLLKSTELNLGRLYKTFVSIQPCHRIIVCSNLELDEESLRQDNIRVFDNMSRDTRGIEVRRESVIFKKFVKEHSPFYQLAKILDKGMRSDKEVKMLGILEKFHVMLVKECVFNVTQNVENKFIARFHDKFIHTADEGLKPVIAQLRRYLKSINNGELLTNKVLKVSRHFGKENNSSIGQTHRVSEVTDDESIKKFFQKLEFMTSEESLDCRADAIGEMFQRIQTEYHVEQLNNELFEILQRGRNQADLFPSLKRKILCCELMNYHRKKNDKEIKLEFEPNSLESLKCLLTESRQSTIVLKSDNPRLCALKLQQVIESMSHKYPEGRYFFLDIDELLSAKENLLTVLAASLEHLLIVQTDAVDLKNEQVKYCIKDIRERISNSPNGTSKMVIIQNINDPTLELNFDVTVSEEIFNNQARITKDSQDRLSEFDCQYCDQDDIVFQKITLKELILQPDDLLDLLNSAQCVNELVNGKLILGEKLTKPCNFDTTYIQPFVREIKRYISLNSAVIKKENNDIFVISGFENQSKGNNVHYYGDMEDAETRFKEIAIKNRKFNVHLLKRVSIRDPTHLVWQRSSLSISTLMKYAEYREVAVSKSIDNLPARRIVILCGKPYSGKSYYLFQMAYNLLIKNKDLEDWVVQVNLSNSMIDQYSESPLNSSDEAVLLLTKILGYDRLRCRLFHLSASDKLKMKLSIFVDSLEELSQENVSKVSEILRLLRQTKIKRIWVATRPNNRKMLEQALDDFAFNLDSISQDKKKAFLMDVWLSLADENVSDKALCDSADKIFKSLKSLISKCEPLYLHILALVCWPYMKNGQDVPPMRIIYDICTEYFDKFLNNLEESKRYRFCMHRLLPLEVIRKLNFHEEERFGEEYRKLNHSSFAEYGVAKWLASLPLDDQIMKFNAMEDLVTRISTIFFQTFTQTCKVSYSVYIERIGNNRLVVDLFTRHLWNQADDQQRLSYLRTALIYSEELFKIFLNKLNDTGSIQILEHGEFRRQEYATSSLVNLLNREKLILEAAERNNINLTCELMLKGADVREVPSDHVERTAIHVVSTLLEPKSNQSHPYWSIAEILLKRAPRATANFNERVQLPKLLSYFFAHGRLEVIQRILTSLGTDKKKQLLDARVDNRTPLDIVNSSVLMSDEQRLDITKFVLNGHDHNSESIVFSVMTAAAKCGHVRCFEFFTGKSDQGRLPKFIKKALRSNQLDVLRFLLKNNKWTVDYNCNENQPLHTAVIEGASIRTLKYLLKRGVNNQNSNGETALALAIKTGVDLRIVKFLVKQEADPNAKDNSGLAPWCYAVLADWCSYSPEQQIELMRFLKLRNFKPSLRQPNTFELDYWNKEIDRKLKYLWNLENFDLNFDPRNRMPRLHSALRKDDFVWFNFLLQHGADPNVLDSKHRTALHIAVGMENNVNLMNSVRQLLRHGAIFNKLNENGHAPINALRNYKNSTNFKGEAYKLLHRATEVFECIELLHEELSSFRDTNLAESTMLYWLLYCRDRNQRTLLHRAAQQALPRKDLQHLLEFGELYGRKSIHRGWLDARDVNGDTAAHEAARLGNWQMLQEVAQKGACLDLQNSKGETPLDLAKEPVTRSKLEMARNLFANLREGSVEMSLLMSTRYFCANIRDEQGRSLLHAAASGQNVPLLLKWRGDPDAKDNEGRTPLHHTVEADNLEATKMLIKAGASVDARDARDRLPIDLRNQERNDSAELVCRLIEMLERSWRDELDVTKLKAMIDGLSEEFDLEPSVAASASDRDGNSMVHHAVRNCDLPLLKALLERGAVYDRRNAANQSPMDLADGEIRELLSVVDRLFENTEIDLWEAEKDVVGLEVMLQCRKVGGYTLFHAVLENGKIEEARWLMEMGADVNVTNNVGASARKLAEALQVL